MLCIFSIPPISAFRSSLWMWFYIFRLTAAVVLWWNTALSRIVSLSCLLVSWIASSTNERVISFAHLICRCHFDWNCKVSFFIIFQESSEILLPYSRHSLVYDGSFRSYVCVCVCVCLRVCVYICLGCVYLYSVWEWVSERKEVKVYARCQCTLCVRVCLV